MKYWQLQSKSHLPRVIAIAEIILKLNPRQPLCGWNVIPLAVCLKKDFLSYYYYLAESMSFSEHKVSIDLCETTIKPLIMT